MNRITYSNNGITKNKVACIWIYILSWVLKKFPTSFCGPSWILYEQCSLHSLNCCGKTFFTVTIINLLNVILRIHIIRLLPKYFIQTHHGMLGRQYVPKDVCRRWHSRVSTARPWRMGADRLPTPMVPAQLSVPLQQIEE